MNGLDTKIATPLETDAYQSISDTVTMELSAMETSALIDATMTTADIIPTASIETRPFKTTGIVNKSFFCSSNYKFPNKCC